MIRSQIINTITRMNNTQNDIQSVGETYQKFQEGQDVCSRMEWSEGSEEPY